MKPVNQHIIVEGTIQAINVRATNPPNQVYDVYFKDDTNRQFAFCTTRPDIFQDTFGANFVTAMPGKTVEVEGWLTKGCRDVDGGIQLTLVRQIRVLGPGKTSTPAHVWSPSENPIPTTTPVASATPSTPAPPAGATRGATRDDAASARTRSEVVAQRSAAATAPAPAAATRAPAQPAAPAGQQPTQPAQPAPPAQPAQPNRDEQFIQSVLQMLRARTPEPIILEVILVQKTPHTLSGADRAKLEDAGASETLLEAIANPASIQSRRNTPAAPNPRSTR